MAFDSTTKRRMDAVRFGLIAAAVLLGAWACARVAGYYNGPARAEDRVAQAAARSAPDANEVKPYLDRARETAEALKKRNLFSKEPPKEHPVKQIDGILGAEVLIGDKWYKAGDKVGDAKIVTIEPTKVTVEWDGQKKVFSPLGGDDDKPSGPSGSREAARKRAPEPEQSPPDAKAEVVHVTAAPTVADDDPLAWMGVKLPPGARTKILDMWNKASDEEKAKAKEEWNNMSDDKKQEALREMESM